MAGPAVLAIDCGGTRLRSAVMRGGEIVVRHPDRTTPDDLAGLGDAIAAEAGGVAAVGVGVAGLVAAGTIVWMPHRRGGPVPLAADLTRRLGVPVVVDNDANMAGLAEARHGAGAGHRAVLMVTMGTGIGGALVLDGRVERGRGHLGEIGHLPFDPGLTSCVCGLRGCWEAVASGRALDTAARRLAGSDPRGAFAADAPTGSALVAAARKGDPLADRALGDVATAFGRGLGALVAAFDPDVIVVGGVGAAIGDPFLEPARGAMMEATPGGAVRRETPVLAARFGEDAGLIGAALAAAEVTA